MALRSTVDGIPTARATVSLNLDKGKRGQVSKRSPPILDQVSERTDAQSSMENEGKHTVRTLKRAEFERIAGKSENLGGPSVSSPTGKRGRSPSVDSSDDSACNNFCDGDDDDEGDDDNNNSTTNKKRKTELAYPRKISTPEPPSGRYRHISLSKETHTLKVRYSHRQKKELRRLRGRLDYNTPPFPEELWEAVLLHEYVDLNALKLTLPSSSSSSFPITTCHEWTLAWDIYSKAVLFLYPHRASELEAYFSYILSFCCTEDPTFHYRVVVYDRAFRKRLPEDPRLTLLDIDAVSGLHLAIFSPMGILYQEIQEQVDAIENAKERAIVKAAAGKVCFRWNRGGECMETTCRYLHKCKACGAGHREATCGAGGNY